MAELKTDRPFSTLQRIVHGCSSLALCLLLALLAGPAVSEPGAGKSACVKGNFEQVTLCPGASAYCGSEPCNALFEMPPGEGEHQVTSNNMDLGTFPAGQTVNLGAFWRGTHNIEVQGTDAPVARFWVTGDM